MGALVEYYCTTASAYSYVIRAVGSTDNDYMYRRNTISALCVGIDANKKFQFKMSSITADIYVLGYFAKPSIRKNVFTRDDIGEIRENGFVSKALTVQGDAISGEPLSTQSVYVPVSSFVNDIFTRATKGALSTQVLNAYSTSLGIIFVAHLSNVLGTVLDGFIHKSICSDMALFLLPVPNTFQSCAYLQAPMSDPWGVYSTNYIAEGMKFRQETLNKIVDSGLLFSHDSLNATSATAALKIILDIREGLTILNKISSHIVDSGLLFKQDAVNVMTIGASAKSTAALISEGFNLLESLKCHIDDSGLLFKQDATSSISKVFSVNLITKIADGLTLLRAYANKIEDSGILLSQGTHSGLTGGTFTGTLELDLREGVTLLRAINTLIVDSGLLLAKSESISIGEATTQRMLTMIAEGVRRALVMVSSGSDPIKSIQAVSHELSVMSALFSQFTNSDNTAAALILPNTIIKTQYALSYPDDTEGIRHGFNLMIDGVSVIERVLSINITGNETDYVNSIEIVLAICRHRLSPLCLLSL
ncbi:hypothetical protein MBAV_002592 [Candidatus Magnetobacterium bavaricum]|uniref:Uncharacterized protein n=1 Tax=Candidatus Magnetobacterium bavaricum TaxID=29290 RepID=A0A0F3GTL2_9BACT|nr:hypothetical protein MBAV_002592 [Candidatus Magnetobacterium bavaricum]